MVKYNFSVDWFSGNIPIWSYFLNHFKGKPSLNFLEIGSFQGKASVWLLENILTDKTSKLTCIDTFEGSIEHHINPYFKNMLSSLYNVFLYNISDFKDQVIILKDKSENALYNLTKDSYDFVYIDGDHNAHSVIQDAVLSFPLLKIGGIMVFDDYTWGINNEHDAKYNIVAPRPAIDAFMLLYRDKIDILHVNQQAIIRRVK